MLSSSLETTQPEDMHEELSSRSKRARRLNYGRAGETSEQVLNPATANSEVARRRDLPKKRPGR